MEASHFHASFPPSPTRLSAAVLRHLPTTASFSPFFLSPDKYVARTKILQPLKITGQKALKGAVRMRSIAPEETPLKSAEFDAQELEDFLCEDLSHLFDDQGIDRTAYDERMKFRDPITKHDNMSGYLFNIAMLKKLFNPHYQLHWAKQTGPYEITTRWTVVMRFCLLPWKPELVFTGNSIMGINPETKKFCSQVDYWDSIENNEYFSMEGVLDMLKQLGIYKTLDLETPKYQILKRTANYEVRKYEPFNIVETNSDKLSGSSGFNSIAGYILGKNATAKKIPMTTHVFTQAPNEEGIKLRKVEGVTVIGAVSKFSGNPTEDIVREKEKALRSNLIRDGVKPKTGCMLARYNDPGSTPSFMMRNEVLIWLEEFSLD